MKRNETGEMLTEAQSKAVAALAGGASLTAAAEAAGVSRVTVWRWRRDEPDFLAALNAAREDARQAVRGELRALATQAVGVVRDILESAEIPAAIRLKAALAVVEGIGGFGSPESIGPTDPDVIRAERAKAEADWERWGGLFDDAMPSKLVVPTWTTARDRRKSAS